MGSLAGEAAGQLYAVLLLWYTVHCKSLCVHCLLERAAAQANADYGEPSR
jgi:hypothetical protein